MKRERVRIGVVLAIVALFLASPLSCKKHSKHSSSAQTSGTFESFLPTGSKPPLAVNLVVAMAENSTLAEMQSVYALFVNANVAIFNITEGQVRINHVKVFDNAHPGTTSSQYATINSSAEDIAAWTPANFNGPGSSYVALPGGRNGRFMGIPTNVGNATLIHEFGHFLFQLTWPPAPIFVDEYTTAPTDSACIMELTFVPLRFCWTDNHQSQTSQPRACWEQLLIDYPSFTYANTNTAGTVPPDPSVEYVDAP